MAATLVARKQLLFALFYRNQFQSNGDFRNIWCIWYLSEPSVNKTCFARIFRLFQLFPITVILVSRLLLTKKVRKMTDLWEFPDLDSNWQNLSLQDLGRLFSQDIPQITLMVQSRWEVRSVAKKMTPLTSLTFHVELSSRNKSLQKLILVYRSTGRSTVVENNSKRIIFTTVQ